MFPRRHPVDVVLALERVALLLLGVEQLVCEALSHRLLTPLAGEMDEPADRQCAGAASRHLDRHLVGGAAHTAGADLEHRGERLDAPLELLDRVASRALGDDRERVVDDLLGDGLLAVEHHLVDDLLDEPVVVDRISRDRPDLRGGAARHYFAFTPYCERAFLRSPTPAASRVPRMTF